MLKGKRHKFKKMHGGSRAGVGSWSGFGFGYKSSGGSWVGSKHEYWSRTGKYFVSRAGSWPGAILNG